MVLDYLLDNPVVIVLLMVGSGMLLWRASAGAYASRQRPFWSAAPHC